MSDPLPDPIVIALREDLGDGDTTTQFFVREDLRALGRIVARERAVVAGTETAAEVFRRVNPKLNVEILQPDGTALAGGETILEVRGAAASILTAERVAAKFGISRFGPVEWCPDRLGAGTPMVSRAQSID